MNRLHSSHPFSSAQVYWRQSCPQAQANCSATNEELSRVPSGPRTESFIRATPATNTDVSTTPLDLPRFCDNGYLRLCLLRSAVFPNSALNIPKRNVADI